MLQASALRHAGHYISSGERWVMVLFLMADELRFGEHVRQFQARASWLMQEATRRHDAVHELRARALRRQRPRVYAIR